MLQFLRAPLLVFAGNVAGAGSTQEHQLESKGYYQTSDRGLLRFLQDSEIDDEMRQIPGLDARPKTFGAEPPEQAPRSRTSAGMVFSALIVAVAIAALMFFALFA